MLVIRLRCSKSSLVGFSRLKGIETLCVCPRGVFAVGLVGFSRLKGIETFQDRFLSAPLKCLVGVSRLKGIETMLFGRSRSGRVHVW